MRLAGDIKANTIAAFGQGHAGCLDEDRRQRHTFQRHRHGAGCAAELDLDDATTIGGLVALIGNDANLLPAAA